MWYDKSRILSYNKILSFVIGNRGGGKTYNAKEWCIKDFLKNKKQFVWIRRYKEELLQADLDKFFDDIKNEFPKVEFKIVGKTAYINDQVAGFFVPLSVSMKKKSVPYPDVNKLIYDEFIIDKAGVHYIKNEPELFLEFFSTVTRLRTDVRALFLANAVSVVNPYFLFFNIKPDMSKRFTVNNHIVVELFKDQDFIDKMKSTPFGQLVEGTNYGKYAIENNFLRDSNTFVMKKTPDSEFMLGIKYNNVMYGFWVDYKEGLIFVNYQYDQYSYSLYAMTKNDHEPNLLLIKSLTTCKPMQRILYAFQHGLIRFHDMQVKNQFYEFIAYFVR
jgi:hypothetical protein